MPVALFQTRMYGGGTNESFGTQYDVSDDGRFLINTVLDDGTRRSRCCRTGIQSGDMTLATGTRLGAV